MIGWLIIALLNFHDAFVEVFIGNIFARNHLFPCSVYVAFVVTSPHSGTTIMEGVRIPVQVLFQLNDQLARFVDVSNGRAPMVYHGQAFAEVATGNTTVQRDNGLARFVNISPAILLFIEDGCKAFAEGTGCQKLSFKSFLARLVDE